MFPVLIGKIGLCPGILDEIVLFIIDVPAGTNFKNPLMVEAQEGQSKSNLYINVQCNYLNDNGSLGDYFGAGYVEAYLNLSHKKILFSQFIHLAWHTHS